MDIKLWYSKHMRQWRWSLIDPATGKQESGQQWDLHDAMGDVEATIELAKNIHKKSSSVWKAGLNSSNKIDVDKLSYDLIANRLIQNILMKINMNY